jgi:hypothetical protein
MPTPPASWWCSMTFTKTAALAAVLAATLASSARAETLTRTIQYHADAQPTIYCAAALLCEIRFADGEKITRAWNPQAQIWSPDGGEVNGRPIVTLKPEAAGFHANFVILTTRREYHIMLVSYDATKQRMRPLYTQFAYDDEARLNARRRAREVALAPKPVVTPPPLTIAQQMDAACAKMPVGEQYGTDVQPAELRPYGVPERHSRSVCHTLDATYIQMPLGGPNPTNVPSLVEDDPGGTRVINYTYDPESRIYRVDDVATEYALVVTNGRRESRMRIQRQIASGAVANAVPQSGKH